MGRQWAVVTAGWCMFTGLAAQAGEGVALAVTVRSLTDQKPIPGAELIVERLYAASRETFLPEDTDDRLITRAESNERGEISLEELPRVPMQLTIRAKGYVSPAEVLLKGTELRHGMELSLPPAIDVTGRVVDDAGKPVPNVQVQLPCALERDGKEIRLSSALKARTDASGKFQIPQAPEGSVRFTVAASGYALRTTDALQRLSKEPIELVIRRTGSLRVEINAPPHKRGQYFIQLEALNADGTLTKIDEKPGADRGAISFIDVAAGKYVVSARIPTRGGVVAAAPLTKKVEVETGRATEVWLTAEKEP